ncbi:hypothetical protein Ciccas_013984 [Cichlidogyrus casuarinus]|uniref:HTH CENPB-type domain-containing protein n=1 Tax=Cichlidogyrus casuarinus TaxID=1844966 RepID=A0ABD2PJ94_9PLAT
MKAHSIAAVYGETEFKGSQGWLTRFKKRHGILSKKRKGERAAVSMDVCAQFRVDRVYRLTVRLWRGRLYGHVGERRMALFRAIFLSTKN